MEVSNVLCCQRDVCPASECPESIHRPARCEQCSRTRLISICDCDSDIVDKCRPYRSSSARSRYVNVCAAVCLLLLVGGLSPQSSAAPGRSRAVMSRQKRALEENYLWGNPCDFADSSSKSIVKDPNAVAMQLVKEAKMAIIYATQYKDTFVSKIYGYQTFDEFASSTTDEWLRKFQLPDEVLPKEKVLGSEMPEEYVDKLMTKIDDVLPSMNKALKLIVAALHSFATKGLNSKDFSSDEIITRNITQTIQAARAVLCLFNHIMTARNLEILPLPDSEISGFTEQNMLHDGLVIFRDSLNYLEYLGQVFQKLYKISV